MKRNDSYEEMFIGLILILVLSDSYEPSLRFAKSAKNIYVVILAVYLLFEQGKFQPLNGIYKIFFPFTVLSFFCLFYSETIGISLQKTLSYFLMFLLVPNYLSKIYREKGPEVLKNIIFFCAFLLLVSCFMIFISSDVAFTSGRYRGIFGNPNGIALFDLLFSLFFFIVKDRFKGLFSPGQVAGIYALIVFTAIFANSRNAILAMLIFFVFSRFYRINPGLGLILVVITAFLSEFISSNFISIISSMGLSDYFRVNTLDDGSGRYVAWRFAWDNIQRNLFIGKGFGYSEYYMRSNWDTLTKLGTQGGVHNTYLSLWMDTGLVGLILYWRSFLLAFFKASKLTKLAFPAMLAICFAAFFESWLIGSLNPHTILFLMIVTILMDETFYPSEIETEHELNLVEHGN